MRLKQLLLIAALCSMTLLSCKDDEDEKASIVGTWQGDKMEYSFTPAGSPTSINNTEDDFDATLQFKEDGTVSLTYDGQTTTGTYEVQGSNLITNINFETSILDLSGTFKINQLTATSLVLFLEKDVTTTYPGTTTTVNGKVKATLYFKRT